MVVVADEMSPGHEASVGRRTCNMKGKGKRCGKHAEQVARCELAVRTRKRWENCGIDRLKMEGGGRVSSVCCVEYHGDMVPHTLSGCLDRLWAGLLQTTWDRLVFFEDQASGPAKLGPGHEKSYRQTSGDLRAKIRALPGLVSVGRFAYIFSDLRLRYKNLSCKLPFLSPLSHKHNTIRLQAGTRSCSAGPHSEIVPSQSLLSLPSTNI